MKSGRSLKPSNILTMQVSMVSDYIIKLLRGQNTSITRIPSSVTASVYLALLPSIWTVINDSYPELSSHVTDVLQALLEHASQTPSKSRTKHITIEFVARLFLVSSCNLKPSSLAHQSGDYSLKPKWTIMALSEPEAIIRHGSYSRIG